jgi:hypothetical protein
MLTVPLPILSEHCKGTPDNLQSAKLSISLLGIHDKLL